MKCLDHIDMTVMAGAVATVASAAVLWAYLGIERGPLIPAEPITAAMFLQQEMEKTINEALVTPARLMAEQGRAQAALGRAIVTLGTAKERGAAYKLDLEAMPAPHAMSQADLGRLIVAGSHAWSAAVRRAEAHYGLAVRDAVLADRRGAGEPEASRATMVAAGTLLKDLAKRTPTEVTAPTMRETGFGYGSIGDGTFLPFMILGAGVLVLLGVGATMMEGTYATRTVAGHCDEHAKDVVVKMLVSDDTPYKVVQCSVFNGGPVTCDEHCLRWPLAHAA